MILTTCPAEHELLPLLTEKPGPSDATGARRLVFQLSRPTGAARPRGAGPPRQRRRFVFPSWCDPDERERPLAGPATDPEEPRTIGRPGPTPRTDSEIPRAPPRPATESPARIGKYLVVGELDDGGSGDRLPGRSSRNRSGSGPQVGEEAGGLGETDLDLSSSEARILGELDHPGLVRVVDLDVHDGRMFLAMDYIRGRSLQQYAKDRPVDSREAARLVIQVASAAEAVHRRGIIHQDIKPKNILVDESGRARLIDFGMARWRHAWSLTEDGPSGGTPEFMAPSRHRARRIESGREPMSSRWGPCSISC